MRTKFALLHGRRPTRDLPRPPLYQSVTPPLTGLFLRLIKLCYNIHYLILMKVTKFQAPSTHRLGVISEKHVGG